jgi:hypothetical protein
MCCPARHEPLADLSRRIQLATREGPRPLDRITWSVVCWCLCLEQGDDSLGTVCRSAGPQSPVRFAERLRRSHGSTISHTALVDPWAGQS